MDKKRKWQFALILTVILLTIYNILPTLFYYFQPLGSPVSQSVAEKTALDIAARVDQVRIGFDRVVTLLLRSTRRSPSVDSNRSQLP